MPGRGEAAGRELERERVERGEGRGGGTRPALVMLLLTVSDVIRCFGGMSLLYVCCLFFPLLCWREGKKYVEVI